jgi:ferredoxin
MADVEIKFERENLDGIVAVGTYLIDAMKRLGIRTEGNCVISEHQHYCVVEITNGSEKLSPLTTDESEYFKVHGHKKNDRLACEAVIEKGGEVAVMTKEKKEEEKPEEQNRSDEYRKAFEEMPLEKKIASLVRLEAIAFGETVSFIVNSPLKIFDKIGDVMAEFGLKLENESKAAGRPKEHSKKKSANESKPKGKEKEESSDTSQDQ